MTAHKSDIESAVSILLTPGGLDLNALDAGLGYAMGAGIDYADLYFQRTWQEGWVLEDGEVKEASYNIDGGVGVRSLAGEKTGFAYSNQITADALMDTGRTASGIVRSGKRPVGVFREILVAWRIKQIDGVAGVVELKNGGGNRDAPLLFQLHPVGRDLALLSTSLHRTSLLNGTAIQQQFLSERGFPGVRVGNNREIPASRHCIQQLTSVLKC